MFRLTESEIMASWSKEQPVRVSVCCITYKQEQYISQAIDSFLMQKTTFPFEIIIGEDCGGDDTLSILSKYQARYPNLIKVITSEDNVGANANLLRVFGVAKGDYIAICEGDDYWIDKLKIQKQYDILNSKIGIDLCFTSAYKLSVDGMLYDYASSHTLIKTYDLKDIIRGGGGFMPTASLMFKYDVIREIPDWFVSAPIGDFYLQVWCSLSNGAIFIPDKTCVYRLNSVGSWSNEKFNMSEEKIIDSVKSNESCVRELMLISNKKYTADYEYSIAMFYYGAASLLTQMGAFYYAKAMIIESWRKYPRMTIKQFILYVLKNHLWIIKKTIKNRI
ncbi:glycosyltransferase family 2 protein [Aeromonas salmonicida]|uniref:glycosyltransferase family 2 protein n=1 Tax=Aeromonas salmonicida TaxID=645 RepID=UPI000DE5B5A8|nr:glycosyltransferase [Aeromonas salmonicida]